MTASPSALVPSRPAHDRVLVTGAAGFVGSRTVALLRRLGVAVVALDDLSVGLPLPAAVSGLVPLEADIRDRARMAAILAGHRPQAIVHLAALHHIPTCEREPHRAHDINILGTQSLLDAAQALGEPVDLLLASSGAVYDWHEGALDEDRSPLRASDVYSIDKLANEAQVAGWAAKTGNRACIARLFNVIGTGDPNGHLIPDVMSQLARGVADATIALGNTAPRRDYIYVDDVASGLVAMLGGMADAPPVETYNLCTGDELSVAGLVELIGEIMGVRVTVAVDPARVRKVDRPQQLGRPDKLADRLGWRAQWTARDALAHIVAASGYQVKAAA